MTQTLHTRLLILGGGPGGYVAGIRAGQLGIDTVLIEGDRVGGTCLIRGCIPSKALIHVASKFEVMAHSVGGAADGVCLSAAPTLDMGRTIAWKETVVDRLNGGVAALLKRQKVRVVKGWGRFTDAKTCIVNTAPGQNGEGELAIKAETVLLAAGSVPAALPQLPFGGDVISSTEALSLSELPKRLVVIGAGYIGLELGSAFRKFGCAVTVVEAMDRILPLYDDALTKPVKTWLEKSGVTLHLSAKAHAFENGELVVDLDGKIGGGEILRLPADKLLVTVGRRPRTQGWGLETMGLDMAGPFVKVNARMETAMRGVYAIGDLVGEPMLEHKAAAQAHVAVENIAGQNRTFAPNAIAAVCFTEPEIVSCGLSPTEAAAQGTEAITGVFPFAANGRALSMEAGDGGGFTRVVARKSDHRVIGLQAVGRHVSELAGEFCMSIEMGAVLEDLAGAIHVHPTLSETVHEAALRALGHPIHI
jgi:dihydrolipoamide dehydrogenase